MMMKTQKDRLMKKLREAAFKQGFERDIAVRSLARDLTAENTAMLLSEMYRMIVDVEDRLK